jgi:hypothetical protein
LQHRRKVPSVIGIPVMAYIAARCAASIRPAAQASARPSFQVTADAIGPSFGKQTNVGSCPVNPMIPTC